MRKQEHKSQDELKHIRRMSYIKMAAMVGLVIAIIAFSSIAWFTMNKENSASGLGVKTQTVDFELKSKGTIGLNAAYPANEFDPGVVDGEFYRTDTDKQKAKWRMQLAADEELEPGEKGVLEFWVKPKGASSIDLDFTLSMRGFTEASENDWNECSNPTAVGYLNGHILFFEERVEHKNSNNEVIGYSYKGLISPSCSKQNITESNAIDIYWVWPETALQYLSVYDDTNQGIADDADTLEEIAAYVNSNQAKVFAEGSDHSASDIATALETWLDDEATASSKNGAISVLGKCYNRADSAIAADIQGALTVLDAEPKK